MPDDPLSPISPACSIIIPVYREQEWINECLRQLCSLRGIQAAEVIVVDGDGGSTLRSIRRTGLPFPLVELTSEKGRGNQLNAGARAADGSRLLFLHVDTQLPRRGLDLVRRTLRDHDAGAFSLGVTGATALFDTWLAYANGRKRLSFAPYGDQALFMSRETFRRVGGYARIPIMEDVEMTDRLKRGGFRLKLLHSKVLTSDRRWRRHGYLLNFLKNTAILTLYRMGVSPYTLAEYYRSNSDRNSKKSGRAIV